MADDAERERIRVEAAAWVARLDANPDEATKHGFSQWIESFPENLKAYERALGAYRQSALLRQSPISRQVSLDSEFPSRRVIVGRAAIAASIAGCLFLATYQLATGRLFGPPLQAVLLSSGPTIRQIALKDGSSLTLGPSSEIEVDLERKERRAELRRGHARLIVSGDVRPFTLMAGSRRLTVRDGQYDMDLDHGAGSIVADKEVSTAPSAARADTSVPAGQHSTVPNDQYEFASTRLGDVADLVNRQGQQPVLEIDPMVANLRVTGLFRAGDTPALARSLAATLNLNLSGSGTGTLLLEPRSK